MKPKTTTTMTTAPRCDYSTARIVKKLTGASTFLLPLLSTTDRQKYITRHTHKKNGTDRNSIHSSAVCWIVRVSLRATYHTIPQLLHGIVCIVFVTLTSK